MDFAACIPDMHRHWHDKRAWAVCLQVLRHIQPKIIIILGDYLDAYWLSNHPRDPNLGTPKQIWAREIQSGKDGIRELEDIGAGLHVFIEGNHEARLAKRLKEYVPALEDSVTLRSELGLNDYWKWIPYSDYQKYQIPGTEVFCRHEPPAGGGIDNIVKQAGASIVFGHDHTARTSTFISKVAHAEIYACGSGWLGDFSQPIFRYVKIKPSWSQAFTLVDSYGGIHLVRIRQVNDQYLAIFGNKEFWG